jgi:hypothetical protein
MAIARAAASGPLHRGPRTLLHVTGGTCFSSCDQTWSQSHVPLKLRPNLVAVARGWRALCAWTTIARRTTVCWLALRRVATRLWVRAQDDGWLAGPASRCDSALGALAGCRLAGWPCVALRLGFGCARGLAVCWLALRRVATRL